MGLPGGKTGPGGEALSAGETWAQGAGAGGTRGAGETRERGAGGLGALHSRYNPRGEAERYVNALSLRENARYFILIEPGLGYIVPPLRRRFPGAKIIALHLSEPPPGGGIPPEEGPHARWSPGGGATLQRFLEAEIPEAVSSFIQIVEWRPALGLFGEKYLGLLGECADFIKRLDAGDRTARYFGGRWFRNFFRNIGLLQKTFVLQPCPFPGPLVITGAGPSLEDTIPLIRKGRQGLFVLASASSAPALEAGGIVPDLLITTDGGNWARLHLHESLRGGAAPALAAGYNAALPSQCAALPLLLLCDGSLWQSLVLRGLSLPCLSLPQRGTVTAAALDLAFSLCRGNVFITGMDLSHRDIRTHARPYAFDRLWEEEAGRFRPAYGRHFSRSGEIAAGGSQAVYAAWFRERLASWPARLYSLGGNNPVFKGLEGGETTFPGGPGETGTKPLIREIPLAAPEKSRERGLAILRRALEEEPYGERLREELGPILCPGEAEPSRADIRAALSLRAGGGHG